MTGPCSRRKIARMDGRAGSRSIVVWTVLRTRSCRIVARLILATIRWRSIRPTCFFGRYHAAVFKYSWLRCSCDRWLPHVHGSPELRVRPSRMRMLNLNRCRRNMFLSRRSLFFRLRTTVDSTVAAVVADASDRRIMHGRVVNVVNLGDINVVHCSVVEKAAIFPTPAFVALTEVGKAVHDPAVETDARTPVAVIKNKALAAPAPIARSPKETDFRSQYPCARHPIVIVEVVAIGPVVRCPDVTLARTKRLFIDWQRGRGECNDDAHRDLRKRCCRHRQHNDREQQHTNETNMHRASSRPHHPSLARCCSTAAGCVD